MARTRKTKPLWVLLRDGYHKAEANHAPHTPERPCDLPDQPEKGWNRNGCNWVFVYRGVGLCGCPMCSADVYGTPRRKRDRAEAKRQISEQRSDG